ncbi:CopD family protein [Allomuricauda sp. SCSIO 65647]|uniref:CopD family protein n=1 Tax=Allomuricauda sp. SCSIO 65647 TaxID=2908843 RepID=UPI001F2C1B68|nr:CopD family protein [Muricauda sp. SCSIO 65647]UJH68475.1 CopD family protein [Muricauda sp. SCSIO 65647]
MATKMVIFIHILAAMVWTGGHLVLSIGFLPRALRQKNFDLIKNFESKYEPIGMPSLLILLVTGLFLAFTYAPDFFDFNWKDHYTRHIAIKLVLLLATISLAVHARFFLFPRKALKPLAWHIVLVTLISVLFVFVGFSARSGGLL